MTMFDHPLELDDVSHCLSEEQFHRYANVVSICAGVRTNFEGFVAEARQVYDLFVADGRDVGPVKRLVKVLCDACLGRSDSGERAQLLLATFNFLIWVPEEAPTPKLERDRAWLKSYQAKLDARRAEREMNARKGRRI